MSNMENRQKLGKIHIYTGDGKGKTTASLGLAIRALGNNLKVGIIYFDKGGDYYGERKILDQLKSAKLKYKAFGQIRMIPKKGFRFENIPADLKDAEKAIIEAQKWMKKDFDLIILDEINTTVKTGLLKIEKIVNLLEQKPAHVELILTGRYAPKEVLEFGDLITEMTMIKHYMTSGTPARKGIEF